MFRFLLRYSENGLGYYNYVTRFEKKKKKILLLVIKIILDLLNFCLVEFKKFG